MGWYVYAISLSVGVGVGVLYGILGVRSPAPPVVALLGLLGMLAGEMLVDYLRGRTTAQAAAAGCLHAKSFAVTTRAAKDAETRS